jgi:hypothetical protein
MYRRRVGGWPNLNRQNRIDGTDHEEIVAARMQRCLDV